MLHATDTPPRRASRALVPPTVTLALWRLRATWRLLLLTGVGILAAVMLVCAVPLYTQVALTAGLRGVLTTTPQATAITLRAAVGTLTTTSLTRETDTFTSLMQQHLGAYLASATESFLQTPALPSPALGSAQQVALTGTSPSQAAAHLTLVAGRLPQAGAAANLELALTPEAASQLGLSIGASLPLRIRFQGSFISSTEPLIETLSFQVVGLIHTATSDPFWQQTGFAANVAHAVTDYPALISSDAFAAALTRLAARDQHSGGLLFIDTPILLWSYHLDPDRIGDAQLDDLIAQLATTQAQLSLTAQTTESSYLASFAVLGPAVPTPYTPSTLESFRDRVAVVQIPIMLLAFQLGGLVLFFVSLMADLLVERQAETIALLRSRGASQRQIFGSFLVQGLGLGALALAIGPLLAMLLARGVAQGLLPSGDQGALNVLAGNPVPVALGVGWYALAAAVCAVLTVMLAVSGATHRNVLDLRRDAARSTRRPFWQRWYLDMVAVILTLVGYGIAFYVTHAGVADAQANLLLTTPLTLLAPLCLVIAGALCFLRLFPSFVRWLARALNRRPGAAPLLALAQMARSPRHALRLVLLLGLTSSFAGFSLVFLASQPQQLTNIAAHQVGADFGGALPPDRTALSLTGQTAAYRQLPGLTSATIGYAADITLQGVPIALRAVDTSTFAQTAIWTDQDSSQPLTTLLAQLSSRQAVASGKIPVIVDALAWQRLQLAIGSQILLPVQTAGDLALIVVAEVQHLPTVNDSLAVTGTSDYTPPGGMLLDYQTLADRAQSIGGSLSANYAWLRTSDDPALLTAIRAALNSGPLQLNELQDRRLILADLQDDPLALTIMGVLAVGASAALALALLGSLLVSWLSVRKRLINFAVLRALGTEPRQLASILLWEQGIIYGAALLLGILFGTLLSLTLTPALVFTGAPTHGPLLSSEEFYVLQHVLSTQILLPPSLLVAFAALVGICAGALWLMARVVSKPSLSQTLRLNED